MRKPRKRRDIRDLCRVELGICCIGLGALLVLFCTGWSLLALLGCLLCCAGAVVCVLCLWK